MKHYGDITKLSGYDLPVVDVITGGSPCQDLSVAGKRAGLAGERSGLFMEQMRIVREMRERDKGSGRTGWAIRPRYMVWENVPGAFSSGNPKGSDFAAVIEEIIKVAEPDANVCVCVPDGGWTKSGYYYSTDGKWSIAWRVHDAQFWGVPQRRKRIALVADFGGLSAPEILFERKGLRWNPSQSGTAGKRAAERTAEGAGTAISFQERSGKPGGAREYSCRMSMSEPCQPSINNSSTETTFSLQGGGATSQNGHGLGIGENVQFTLNSTDIHAVAAVDCRNGTENECVNGTLQAKSQGGYNMNSNNSVRVKTP